MWGSLFALLLLSTTGTVQPLQIRIPLRVDSDQGPKRLLHTEPSLLGVMPSTTTPTPIQAPSAKEKKYDRQLRLWAANGQQALEESHTLLIISDHHEGRSGSGSSVAGVETLKNLVLPSIGNFTIADSALVTEADLGINFFLRPQSLGKRRAEECKNLLEELNPDVKGHALSTVRNAACRPVTKLTDCSHSQIC